MIKWDKAYHSGYGFGTEKNGAYIYPDGSRAIINGAVTFDELEQIYLKAKEVKDDIRGQEYRAAHGG